jgi:hypothetical protein
MSEEMIGDVDMLPGEMPVKSWRAQTATWGPFVSGGVLNLTSERVVWNRKGFNIVPGSSVIVRLDQIQTCLGDDGFNRHRVLLTLKDGSERTFHVLVGVNGSTVAGAINAARSKRGLPDA